MTHTTIPRMRTLDAAYALVLEADPDTSLTKHAIRALAVSGRIQAVKVGAKRLINVDWLLEQLAINPASLSVETSEPSLSTARQPSGVRPIRIAK